MQTENDCTDEGVRHMIAWRKSMRLVESIYRATRQFPTRERYGLTDQLRQAAISIPSNVAEGWGRNTDREFLRFVRIARGSAAELQTQIELARRLEYTSDGRADKLQSEVAEVGKILRGLEKRLERDSS